MSEASAESLNVVMTCPTSGGRIAPVSYTHLGINGMPNMSTGKGGKGVERNALSEDAPFHSQTMRLFSGSVIAAGLTPLLAHAHEVRELMDKIRGAK